MCEETFFLGEEQWARLEAVKRIRKEAQKKLGKADKVEEKKQNV